MVDLRRSNMQNYCYRPGDVADLEWDQNLESATVLRTVGKHLKHVQLCLTLLVRQGSSHRRTKNQK
jgi:hypothetical protein